MPCNHLTLCHPLHLPRSILASIWVFSSESVLRIRWPKYWSFSFNISSSNEHSVLISFRMNWIPLQSKGLSRVFSNTSVQKHQFFGLNRTKGGGRRNSLLSHSALLFELGHLISCSQTEIYTMSSPEHLNTLLTRDVLMLLVLVSTKIPRSIMC